MAPKPIGGISGVLGELISTSTPSDEPPTPKSPSTTSRDNNSASRRSRCPTARLGRPSGNSVQQTRPKEKVTLRISSELIAEYRDWSWDARCQLSELVQRALATYLKSRHR